MTSLALAPYHAPDALWAAARAAAERLGAACIEYGTSVQGRPLRAIQVPSRRPDAPRVLCSANIHGPEYIAAHVALGLLEGLADLGPAAALRERAEVWVIPCLNPDGYARTWDADGAGPLASLRPNANGVDLNRNFPLPAGSPSWLPGAGSSTPGDATYRGTAALCEPETRHLDALLRDQRFHASANLHSFMGTVIPARVRDRTDFGVYKQLARALAAGQRHTRYRRLSNRLFDVFTGEQEDHQHHVHRTWAVCVESFPVLTSFRQHLRAPSTFWRFNPRDPQTWVENDVPGLVGFFDAALRLDRPRARPELPPES